VRTVSLTSGAAPQVGPTCQSTHVAINGFAIGGTSLPAAAAISLDNDAYTDVTNNVLGGQPLANPEFTGEPCPPTAQPLPPGFGFTSPAPVTKTETFGNAANIILSNSDHPNISNNSILGSAIFQFSPVLAVGDVLRGSQDDRQWDNATTQVPIRVWIYSWTRPAPDCQVRHRADGVGHARNFGHEKTPRIFRGDAVHLTTQYLELRVMQTRTGSALAWPRLSESSCPTAHP